MSVLVEDVTAAQQGDIQAFERLVAGSRNTITSIALSIVKDVDASEDIAQQIYINSWQNLHTLKNAASFLPWVRQSARYMASNYLRDNKVSKKVSGDQADGLIEAISLENDPGEKQRENEQYQQIIAQVLDQLPNETREIVLLYYREQESTHHVATLLGLSDAAVRKKLSRARVQIKDKVMKQFGKVILSTAPTVSFTSMVIASLSVSPQAAASVTLGAGTGVNSSWLTKISALFGGAMLGALAGALAIVWSHKSASKQVLNPQLKSQLLLLRNVSLVWVIVFGVLFSLSYALTESAWGPIVTYSMFALGLFVLTKRSQLIVLMGMEQNPKVDISSKGYKFQKFCASMGLYGGVLIGFLGLLTGLAGAGRL